MSLWKFLGALITLFTRVVDWVTKDDESTEIIFSFIGIIEMERIQDDAPDRTVKLSQPTGARDKEGKPIKNIPHLNYSGASDNESAIILTTNSDGSFNIHVEGSTEDGSDNVANITYSATDDSGKDYGVVTGKQYVVTTGDVATFEGITADDGSGVS